MSRKYNNGRIEYRAVQNEVEAKLAAGYSGARIYDELREAGKITISYSNFLFYVRGQGERKHGIKKLSKQKKIQPGGHRPAINQQSSEKNTRVFKHEKLADLDDLGPPAKE